MCEDLDDYDIFDYLPAVVDIFDYLPAVVYKLYNRKTRTRSCALSMQCIRLYLSLCTVYNIQ